MDRPIGPQDTRNNTQTVAPASIGAGSLRYLGTVAVCILLATTLFGCAGSGEDPAGDERVLELEAKAYLLEESLQALADENAELKGEIAVLRQEQTEFVEAQEAAEAAREHEEEVADFEAEQEEQLVVLEEGQVRTREHLDDLDARLLKLEEAASKAQSDVPSKEQWSKDKGKLPEGTAVERTARLAEDSGGEVHYVDHSGRGDRSVLSCPWSSSTARLRSSSPFTALGEIPPTSPLTCPFTTSKPVKLVNITNDLLQQQTGPTDEECPHCAPNPDGEWRSQTKS